MLIYRIIMRLRFCNIAASSLPPVLQQSSSAMGVTSYMEWNGWWMADRESSFVSPPSWWKESGESFRFIVRVYNVNVMSQLLNMKRKQRLLSLRNAQHNMITRHVVWNLLRVTYLRNCRTCKNVFRDAPWRTCSHSDVNTKYKQTTYVKKFKR